MNIMRDKKKTFAEKGQCCFLAISISIYSRSFLLKIVPTAGFEAKSSKGKTLAYVKRSKHIKVLFINIHENSIKAD